MNYRDFHRGFTLLEMLVATLLLGMLITLLGAMFTQSGLAWDVGRASVVDTGRRQRSLSASAHRASDIVPTAEGWYRVQSAWDEQGELRGQRPLEKEEKLRPVEGTAYGIVRLEGGSSEAQSVVRVQVRSAGPDGLWGTEDDLSTAPEEDFE